jgi:uncharacterized protein
MIRRAGAALTTAALAVAGDPMQQADLVDVDIERLVAEAEQGRVESLFELGLCYATGQGVSQDYIEAHKLFNIAAIRGSLSARERRAELARDMTAEQVAEAQRQAREWIARRA